MVRDGDCGAEPAAGGVYFRVWAPAAERVEVVIEGEQRAYRLQPGAHGHHCAFVPGLAPGALYRYRLEGRGPYPDPCSRFQPSGPHGPSMVVDPHAYRWHDGGWMGVEIKGQVIYEMHIGAFTEEGTFDAAARELEHLKDLGVTVLEVMPIAEFPGRWNWGYDGVDLFAPYHGYGDHDAFKRFVDAAHRHALAVMLDVVYNHVGPDGNYLGCYSADYFSARQPNDWGRSINFDGPGCSGVRELYIRNACYWIREFHLDGLRLDATQSIHDTSWPHILAQIAQRARKQAHPRRIILTAENEPQDARYLAPMEAGGFGLDAMWNDDFHHSARVALTGRREGYYHDYRGRAQEFVSAAKHGFLFQGQYYRWQEQARGTPALDQPAWAFIAFIQNHDQVGNTLNGERLHRITSPGRLRAMTALLLLAPHTPLLFMGQEFGASQPFGFFADHNPQLGKQVHAGRREFLSQFVNYATAAAQARVPDPADEACFRNSKLDRSERDRHVALYALHRDLLRIRRQDAVIARQDRRAIDGAVLSDHAFVLRWFDAREGDRLLVVNLGEEAHVRPAPEPLLAPPCAARWRLVWSSDDPRYGAHGAVSPCTERGWRLPGESAALLRADTDPTRAT